MTKKSSEEQKKAAMAAVWDGIIRRSNAKKDLEKALVDSGDANAARVMRGTTTVKSPVDKPTISAAPADKDKPTTETKKPFKWTKKMTLIAVGCGVVLVAIIVGVILWNRHQAYLATPAGQANEIYNDKESDRAKIKKKYGDKYDEYNGDLRRAADRTISGGVNAAGAIDNDKKQLNKWDTDDVGKAQFCIIYAKKTASSDDDISELALVYYLANVETEMGVKVYGVKELPLSSDKYATDAMNSLVKNLTKDETGNDEAE